MRAKVLAKRNSDNTVHDPLPDSSKKDITKKEPIHNKANGVKSSPIISGASFHNNLLTLNTSEGDYSFEFAEGVRELLLNTLK